MLVLVDMDGVLADFYKGFLDIYREAYPEKLFIPIEDRTLFYVQDQYPKSYRPLLESIYLSKGFFRDLPAVDGAIDGLLELDDKHDVFICTAPLFENPYCVSEKYEWVERNIGKGWQKKVIVSKDKTLVTGDILIDDKPEVSGYKTPSWEHILYTQPYNTKIIGKRRITWDNWKSVIGL